MSIKSLPPRYVAGLSSSTAKARAAHWDKTKKMDPRNPAAYEPAPGDKTAKTKESKYTKAYKAKFGEDTEMEEDYIDEEASSGLAKKAQESGISIGILRKVYNRGMAAWRTGHRPGTTPQQWAMARVNSYITKGKTYHTTDSDLREEEVDEACWDGYKKVGMKKKGNRMVPDCVPEAVSPAQQAAIAISMKKAGKKPKDVKENAEPHSKNKMKPSSRFEGSPELVRTYKKDTPGQSTHRIVKKIIEEVLYECGGNCTCGKKPPVTEAKYQGRQVTLNKPMAGDVKKSKVYVKNEKGNVVKVNFGDKNLSIKKNIPARKRSYCARSGGQGNLGKKTSANYWSRRAWKC